MIVSNLQNSARVEALHPLFKQLFDYVKANDLLNAPLGRIELDGDNLFINNVNPECIPAEKQVLEMHRDYIDVHILLTGKETIGWKAIENLKEIYDVDVKITQDIKCMPEKIEVKISKKYSDFLEEDEKSK